MRVQLGKGFTRAYAQIMQHTHKYKAVTGRVEATKLLSHQRQSNYIHDSNHWILDQALAYTAV